MKLIEWVKQAKTKIDSLDAELIAVKALGFYDRVEIALHSDDDYDMSLADEMLEKRAGGLPLAYIIGKKEFFGRDFTVNKNVLIPRPETEQIILSTLSIVKSEKMNDVSILDIGTGSGCIPITLKLELRSDGIESKISAVDISKPALEVAKENAARYGADIDFYESNLLENVVELPDIIIANLPYVDINWDWTSPELKFEPAMALFAEDGGLKLIKQLISNVVSKKNNLLGKHFLILEADTSQHDDVIGYARSFGLELISHNSFILAFKY